MMSLRWRNFKLHLGRERLDVLFIGGKELMERGIEEADGDRQSLHGLVYALKVTLLHRLKLGERFSRCSTVSETIISRIAAIRSVSKNMCSVRQRPMPSAPNLRACAASFGVSAFVRTFRVRILSAQPIRRLNSPPMTASTVGIASP